MSVRIIIDSACDLSKEKADQMHLDYMPLKTMFGDQEFLDGITISHQEFFERLVESDTLPTTSQIPPYEYEQIFSSVAEGGDTAVCITLSSKLSGSYQSACLAASEFEGTVIVVDSENVCIGEQILVLFAARLRDQGKSAQEISDILNESKKHIRLIALLDTLEYLKKGGRISSATAFAGNLLSIKPVVAIENGEVVILGKARGSKNGNNMLMELTDKCGGIEFSLPFCLAYSGLSDALLQKYIKDSESLYQGKVDVLPISTIGSTIGTHAGPGAIAVAFFANNL
ncbi:MAG: DegV family protein [Lachnospiraceae bacterium]|nr:DegV family protein [Lachnospiraceae bacterium]